MDMKEPSLFQNAEVYIRLGMLPVAYSGAAEYAGRFDPQNLRKHLLRHKIAQFAKKGHIL
jgi:hypothetical protein